MASTTINRGNVLNTILFATTLTPSSVGATTAAEQSFTVPGVLVGDKIISLILNGAWTSLADIVAYRVTAANTIGVSFKNTTAGSLTPPAGTYVLQISRPENTTLPTSAA